MVKLGESIVPPLYLAFLTVRLRQSCCQYTKSTELPNCTSQCNTTLLEEYCN